MLVRCFCILIVICLVLAGCTTAGNGASAPEREDTVSASSSGTSVTATPDISITIPQEVVSGKEASHKAADNFPSGNHFAYLYVTDKEGVPVTNLLLLSKDNWFIRQRDLSSMINGLSMNNGLLPFYLKQMDLKDTVHSFVLVNYDDEGKAYAMPLEWSQESFDKLVAGEMLSVVWDQQIPAQTSKQMLQAVDIYLETSEGKPAANMAVMLEAPRMDGPRPETGVEVQGETEYIPTGILNEPRYTDKDGYVRLSNKWFKQMLQNDLDFCYRILVRDSILTVVELSMTEFIVPAYMDGELCEEIRLTL